MLRELFVYLLCASLVQVPAATPAPGTPKVPAATPAPGTPKVPAATPAPGTPKVPAATPAPGTPKVPAATPAPGTPKVPAATPAPGTPKVPAATPAPGTPKVPAATPAPGTPKVPAATPAPGTPKGHTPAPTTKAPAQAIQSVTSFEYQCDIGEDKISFQRNQSNIPSSLEIKVLDFEPEDSNNHNSVYCRNPNPQEQNLKVTLTCSAEKKVVVIVQPKHADDKNVFGGQHIKLFELSCKDSSTITYTVKTQPKIYLPSTITPATPKYGVSGVSLNTDKTKYTIGDKIRITLTNNNNNVSILPVRCTASDGKMTNLSIWDNTNCNMENEELIDRAWTNISTNYRIQVYAFRFKTSHTLLIQCEVNVCRKADSPKCQGSGNCNSKRRKRAARSNSGDITVSKRLNVKDLPYEVSVSGSDAHHKPLTFSVLLSAVISICISGF